MQQYNIFSELYPTFKFKQPTIKLFEAFAGIGSQAKALKRLEKEKGFKLEVVGISEFDKYALSSYNAIHGETLNYGDITKIEKIPDDIDIFTYSFPCQDISMAGKRAGFKKGGNTRSGLLWEVERLLDVSDKPKVLLMENVRALISQSTMPDYVDWLYALEEMGYSNYWAILNAKNYGIPQNRERVFCVSILGEYYYEFPKPFQLELKLRDILEDEVDEKYFLSDKALKTFTENSKKHEKSGNGFRFKPHDKDDSEIAFTLTTRAGDRVVDNFIKEKIELKHIANVDIGNNESNNRVYDVDGLSPTLNTMQGGNRQPKIVIPEKNKKGYGEAYEGDGIRLERKSYVKSGRIKEQIAPTLMANGEDVGVVVDYKSSAGRGAKPQKEICPTLYGGDRYGVVVGNTQKNAYVGSIDDVSPTLTSAMGQGGGQTPMLTRKETLRIRKLTPKECWRLMGFDDEDLEKAAEVVSKTQLYKQAGNSIVVDVLYHIFKQLF